MARPRGSPRVVDPERRSRFSQCPNGHNLPHRNDVGVCTPLFCCEEQEALAQVPEVKEADPKPENDVKEQTSGAIVQAQKRVIAMRGRRKLVPVPKDLTPAEAEDYVNTRKAQLTPMAIAEKEFQLLYGNDDQRDRAASYILDATGHGKREAGAGSQAVIIINGWNPAEKPWKGTIGALQVPGAKELAPSKDVVEASLTPLGPNNA